jgi:acetyltransferase
VLHAEAYSFVLATSHTDLQVVEIAAQDEYSDGILIVLTPQSMTDPSATARGIAEIARKIGGRKPILASWMGGKGVEEGRAILDEAGIPTYDYPDSAAEMFSYMYKYSVNLSQLYETPRWCAEMHPESLKVDTIIAEAQSSGRTILTELESKQLLSAYGIPTVTTILACTAEEAALAADGVGYPVVVKINSETITHKTDVGGVKLNIHSAEQVREAFCEIEKDVEAKFSRDYFQGVTVQPMVDVRDSYELIVGASPDSQFGPVMLFGSGGTLVEIYQDKALALPPLNSNLAHLMMKETKIYKALKGTRGRSSVDLSALERLIVNFSHCAFLIPLFVLCLMCIPHTILTQYPLRFFRITVVMEKWNWIREIEINPLLVSNNSLVALDARVILHDACSMDVDDYTGRAAKVIRPAIRPYPTQYEQNWVSKKGRVILIRAIMPEDEPLVVDFHKRVSEESVYTRFFSDMKYEERTSHDRLTRVCHIDYDRDIALVALDGEKCSDSDCKLVAAARLTKEHGVDVAEFSILVSDAYQGQGIGEKLLRELVCHAKAEGLHAIEAIVMPSNRAMIHVLEKVGFEASYDKEEGVVKQYLNLQKQSEEERDPSVQLSCFTEPICI